MRFVTVALSCVQGEVERERTAPARLAVDAHEAAVAPHHVIDDGKPEACALRAGSSIGLDPEEFIEDLALQPCRNTDPAVADAHQAVLVQAIHLDEDLAVLG